MTEDLVRKLNGYKGEDWYNEVVYGHPAYDQIASDALFGEGTDYWNRFATVDGDIIGNNPDESANTAWVIW